MTAHDESSGRPERTATKDELAAERARVEQAGGVPAQWANAPAQWADVPMNTTGQLAVLLGGSGDSFTGMLLQLMMKADPGNRARLAGAFPREDRALRIWWECDPAPTFGEMGALLREAGEL